MSEWELRVSQKELHRMHVVRLTMEGRETVGRGARLLGISARQMKRLRRKMKARGVQGLLNGNRGKAPWNKTVSEKIEQVLKLARGRYQGLNDTHLTEKLKEKEKIVVSRATVRTILRQAGIAAVRKRGVKRLDCAPPGGEVSPRFEGGATGGFGFLNRHLIFLRG